MYKRLGGLRVRRLLTVITVLLMAGLVIALSGCAAATAPTTSDGDAAEAAPVEIRLASYGLGDAWNANLEENIATFEEANPNIDVTVEFRPIDAYWDKLQTEFAGDTAPDVTINQMDWVIPGAARGMFLDLMPYIEQDQVDLDAYFYDMEPEWGWQGGLYGGLLYAGGQALYVNKDMLAEAGLDFPSEDWTWDDLLSYATQLTDEEANQWGVYMSNPNPPYWGSAFIHGMGGSVLNEAHDTCTLTEPEARAGLQWVADLIHEHEVMPAPVAMEGQENPFATGRVGLYFGGTWEEGLIRESGIDWDFAHMPAHPETGIRSVQMGSNAWSILSNTEHPDDAWQLVHFLMGEEGQRGMMTQGVPGLSSVVESQDYLEQHEPQDISVVTSDFANYGHDYYPTPDTGEWWNAVAQELSAIWSGEASVEEATDRACQAVDEIFSRRPAEWSQ